MMLMLHWNTPYSGLHHNYYIILANNTLQLVVTCGECLTDCQDCFKSNPRCYIVSTERVRHIITQMTSRQKNLFRQKLPKVRAKPIVEVVCWSPRGGSQTPRRAHWEGGDGVQWGHRFSGDLGTHV